MHKIGTAFRLLKYDRGEFMASIVSHFFKWLPDKIYLKLLYRYKMGRRLDLTNPQTFCEKIQWLKLYDRKPEYTKMVDKYAVKKYMAAIIGEEYIIPTLGVWDTPDDIDWEHLPDQFVLKTTHGGGSTGVVICRDKSTFDRDVAKRRLERSLKSDIYKSYREWPYKDVKKRIIAEEFIEVKGHQDLPDYKFYCFNGEPKYCQVIRDRNTLETIDFYDMEWNHMPFVGLNPVAKNGLNPVAKPEHLTKMCEICRRLATGIPFLRVDLYVLNGKEYFGETTFYPASGIGIFTPDKWNVVLGQMINIH